MYHLPFDASVTRELSLKNGNIFSDYIWKERTRSSHGVKYMIRSFSDVALSANHCSGCSQAISFNEYTVSILHFQANKPYKGKLLFDDSMKQFTPLLQKKIKLLF